MELRTLPTYTVRTYQRRSSIASSRYEAYSSGPRFGIDPVTIIGGVVLAGFGFIGGLLGAAIPCGMAVAITEGLSKSKRAIRKKAIVALNTLALDLRDHKIRLKGKSQAKTIENRTEKRLQIEIDSKPYTIFEINADVTDQKFFAAKGKAMRHFILKADSGAMTMEYTEITENQEEGKKAARMSRRFVLNQDGSNYEFKDKRLPREVVQVIAILSKAMIDAEQPNAFEALSLQPQLLNREDVPANAAMPVLPIVEDEQPSTVAEKREATLNANR